MGIKTTPTLGSSIHLPLEDGDKPTPTLGSSIHLPLEDGDKPHPYIGFRNPFALGGWG